MYSRIPDWFCSWIDSVFKSYWHIPTTSNYLLSIDVHQLFHTFQEFFFKDHEYWMALFCKEFVQVTVSFFFFAYKEYHHCLQKSIKWILRINKKQKWLILTGTWPWNRVLNTLTTIQFHNKYCIFLQSNVWASAKCCYLWLELSYGGDHLWGTRGTVCKERGK